MTKKNGQDQSLYEDMLEFSIIVRNLIGYFRNRFLYLFVFGILGVTFATIFLIITPNKYQAIGQVVLIKKPDSDLYSYLPALYFGSSDELISRMLMPTFYTDVQIKACGFEGNKDPQLALSRSLKLDKNGNNAVNVGIIRNSRKISEDCLNSVMNLIINYENENKEKILEGAKLRLSYAKEALDSFQKNRCHGQDRVSNQTSIETERLFIEVFNLQNFISALSTASPHLSVPVYVSSEPVNSGAGIVLICGLVLGLMLATFTDIVKRLLFLSKA